jgi:Cdc6-like AAA superfamily ATPase
VTPEAEASIDWDLLRTEVGNVFTPAAPIQFRHFFAGRFHQLELIADTIAEAGRHPIVYGERGVGKTSMVNILDQVFPDILVARVPVDSSDSFRSLWRKVLRRIDLVSERPGVGFTPMPHSDIVALSEAIDTEDINPDEVGHLLDNVPSELVIVFDEFDRLGSDSVRRLVADTVKALSDSGSEVTLAIVGVAHDVRDLVGDHPSIERNLRQIHMPLMSRPELAEILIKGFNELGMMLPDKLQKRIVSLSQGFPHYTHLLGKYSALEAIRAQNMSVAFEDFEAGIFRAIEDTSETIRDAYQVATMTTKADSIFPLVLLAAALSEVDEHGSFRATDMVAPMCDLTGRDLGVPNFTYNLGKLSSDERGNVLEKVGAGRPRYRFRNPLMRPYVLMKAFTDGRITEGQLGRPNGDG